MLNTIHNKNYYSQESVVDSLSRQTKYSKYEVYNVLNALSTFVIEKLSDVEEEAEIRICNGIKVSAKKQKKEYADTNLHNAGYMANIEDRIILKSKVTDNLKKKINDLYKSKAL